MVAPTTRDLLHVAYEAELLADRLDLAEAEDRPALEVELAALLDSLAQTVPEKLDALRHVAKRMEALAEAHKTEERRQAAMRRAREQVAARCRVSAQDLVRTTGPHRTTTASYRLQAGSPRVVGPEDLTAWATQGWLRVTEAPDRAMAGASLREMDPADWPAGWSLVSEETLRW